MITKEQRRLLSIAGNLVRKAFPEMYGNVQFNLLPERKKVNANIAFSVIIDYDDKVEVKADV